LSGTNTRTPAWLEMARQERLGVSGSPSQYDNLEVFIEQQELMRRLARDSILPILELDISDNRIPGGLYMPDCIMSLRGMIAVALGPQSDEAISSFIRRLLFEVSH
jgi:hypothetical protein